jgi:homoisocitrate dehydrogenase
MKATMNEENNNKNKAYNICVLSGDGIGPEVIAETIKVLEALDVNFNFIYGDIGFDAYQKLGTPLPQETLNKVQNADATLFGAVTTPPNIPNYSSPVLGLRQHFQLYANIRPSKTLPTPLSRENIDVIVVRENTEGLYCRSERVEDNGDRAITERIITRKGSERIIRYAFELARKLGRKKVTVVHKANVLRATCGLFINVADEVAKDFPEIEKELMIVDNCAMQLIRRPEQFEIIVTTNMFGDILSDESSMLVGGLGVAYSGNIGDNVAVFEAVHGSAPDIIGQRKANPIATILSAKFMLEHLGLEDAAQQVERGVMKTLEENQVTPDLGGTLTTQEVTANIIKYIKGE